MKDTTSKAVASVFADMASNRPALEPDVMCCPIAAYAVQTIADAFEFVPTPTTRKGVQDLVEEVGYAVIAMLTRGNKETVGETADEVPATDEDSE